MKSKFLKSFAILAMTSASTMCFGSMAGLPGAIDTSRMAGGHARIVNDAQTHYAAAVDDLHDQIGAIPGVGGKANVRSHYDTATKKVKLEVNPGGGGWVDASAYAPGGADPLANAMRAAIHAVDATAAYESAAGATRLAQMVKALETVNAAYNDVAHATSAGQALQALDALQAAGKPYAGADRLATLVNAVRDADALAALHTGAYVHKGADAAATLANAQRDAIALHGAGLTHANVAAAGGKVTALDAIVAFDPETSKFIRAVVENIDKGANTFLAAKPTAKADFEAALADYLAHLVENEVMPEVTATFKDLKLTGADVKTGAAWASGNAFAAAFKAKLTAAGPTKVAFDAAVNAFEARAESLTWANYLLKEAMSSTIEAFLNDEITSAAPDFAKGNVGFDDLMGANEFNVNDNIDKAMFVKAVSKVITRR